METKPNLADGGPDDCGTVTLAVPASTTDPEGAGAVRKCGCCCATAKVGAWLQLPSVSWKLELPGVRGIRIPLCLQQAAKSSRN